MKRIENIKIGEKEYPLNLSVKAAEAIEERYGGITKIGEAFHEDNVVKMLNELLWLLSVMMEQGAAYMRIAEGKEIKPLNYEELQVMVGLSDVLKMKENVMKAITAGMGRSVEVESDPKNVETAQNQ